MSAFRGTQFFLSFSQAYIMKAVVSLSKFECVPTHARTQTHTHMQNNDDIRDCVISVHLLKLLS